MTTPGSNLLARAARIIAQTPFVYVKFTGRVNNEVGLFVATYAKPVQTQGSVQPVPRDLYERYGLELQKSYLVVYVQQTVIDVARDTSGDIIKFNNGDYNILSDTRWFPIDGWTAFICVKVEPEAAPCNVG